MLLACSGLASLPVVVGLAVVGLAVVGLVVLVLVGAASAQAPMRLEFHARRVRTAGTGRLESLAEARLEAGVYEIEPRASADGAGELHVALRGRVREQGEACSDRAREAEAIVELPSGHYRGPSERDDLVSGEPGASALAFWLWVPPSLEQGASVRLFDHDYTIERDLELDVANETMAVFLATAHGTRDRDDALGRFRAEWSDTLWFDAETGYLVRRERTELAEADDASFEENETFAVLDASFLPPAARTPRFDPAPCPQGAVAAHGWWRIVIPVAVVLALVSSLWLLRTRLSQGRTS